MTSWKSRISNPPSTPEPKQTAKTPSPKNPCLQCGEFIGMLRYRRGLSRKQVTSRALKQLDEANPFVITESLLKRIESGQVVKLNRGLIEVLALVLNCTLYERFHLLVLADLNPFADSDGSMSDKDMALAYALVRLKDPPILQHKGRTVLHDQLSPKLADDQALQALIDLVDRIKHPAEV